MTGQPGNCKKKVVFFHHFSGFGGAGISLLASIDMLTDNYEVEVYIPFIQNSELEQELDKRDLRVTYYSSKLSLFSIYSGGSKLYDIRFWLRWLSFFNNKNQVEAAVKSNPAAIFAVNSLTLCHFSLFLKNVKSVCFVRETAIKGPFYFIQKHLLKSFSKVLYISKYDQSKWEISNSDVLYNSYEPEAMDVINDNVDKQDYVNILYLGGDSKLKGFGVLKRILLASNSLRVRFVVCGEVSDVNREFLQQFHNVSCKGLLLNVRDAYTNSDIVFLPFLKPHQARPIFEAGAYSKPVIVPNFDCFSEFVTNNKNGYVYKDLRGLLSIIESISHNKKGLLQSGNLNKGVFLKNHMFSANRERLREIIGSL